MVSYATVPILIMEARWESVVRSRSIQQAYVQLGFEISLSCTICLSQNTFMSLTQSFGSFILSLSLPHISSINPRDPKFNYRQAAVGGGLSCTGTAARNSNGQACQANASWDRLHCRPSYSTDRKTELG